MGLTKFEEVNFKRLTESAIKIFKDEDALAKKGTRTILISYQFIYSSNYLLIIRFLNLQILEFLKKFLISRIKLWIFKEVMM